MCKVSYKYLNLNIQYIIICEYIKTVKELLMRSLNKERVVFLLDGVKMLD